MRKEDLLKLVDALPKYTSPVGRRVRYVIRALMIRAVDRCGLPFHHYCEPQHDRGYDYDWYMAKEVACKLHGLGYTVEVEDNNGSIFLEIS